MAPTLVREISHEDLLNLPIPATASITKFKHLSSYNWIEAESPTITVPGCPPLWTPPKISRPVKKDSGLTYIAQNAARHPDSPLEPLFRALYVVEPSFDIRSVDVVTDRNNIRKLLSFVNPSSTKHEFEAFTINVEIHRTREFRGFGHEFEKAYTTNQIENGTGHHRIISYCFGDLNFIVRFETDGHVDVSDKNTTLEDKNSDKIGSSPLLTPDEMLGSMLGSLSLSSTKEAPGTESDTTSKLVVKEQGRIVPPDSILEIKTRVFHKQLGIPEVAPQLWISQTPRLVRAYHRKGVFHQPQVEDVTTQIQQWEKKNESDLKRLAALIREIVTVAKECDGKAVVKCDGKMKLVISKRDGKHILPDDLYAKCDMGQVVESDTKPTDEVVAEVDDENGETNLTKTVSKLEISPSTSPGRTAAETVTQDKVQAGKAGSAEVPGSVLK